MKLTMSCRKNEPLLKIWNQDAIIVVSYLCSPFLLFVKYFMCKVFYYNTYSRCKMNNMYILNGSDMHVVNFSGSCGDQKHASNT